MARKPGNRPTDAELAILQTLWQCGPSTVREIHEQLTKNNKTGYTTVLKTLQIMTDKGLVRRDESQRAHVYSPQKTEKHTQNRLLGDLADRAFRGSAGRMVMQALSSKRATPEEIEEIRRMLDQLSGENSDDNH
jgi:predicted transcriptional regulator